MDTGADELDLPDSPSTRNPGSAPGIPKGSSSRGQSLPAVPEEPVKPVEVQLPAGEASAILGSGTVHTDVDRPGRSKLALPKVLTDRQYWITQQTKVNIDETCGLPGNLKCRQCGKRFTTARRLRVHAPNIIRMCSARVENTPFNGIISLATSVSHGATRVGPSSLMLPRFQNSETLSSLTWEILGNGQSSPEGFPRAGPSGKTLMVKTLRARTSQQPPSLSRLS